MYMLIILVHVIVCVLLIATILLQAGRGGGLTESATGGGMQSMFGTQAPSVLKKATEVAAIAFLVTSLLLGVITARRGQSLMTKEDLLEAIKTQQQQMINQKTAEKVSNNIQEAASQAEENVSEVLPEETVSK